MNQRLPTTRMNTLIRAAEIWVPDTDGYLLEFGAGSYGDAIEFDTVSRALCFGRGEGLPGRVWEEERPLFLERLTPDNFRRTKAASNAGYRAAVGLPFHGEGRLVAIVVLYFGDVAEGASVALWRVDGADRTPVAQWGSTDGGAPSLSLPLGSGEGQRFELTLASPSAMPIGRSVKSWTREDAPSAPSTVTAVLASAMPQLSTTDGDEGAAFDTLVLPIVVDGVATRAIAIDL